MLAGLGLLSVGLYAAGAWQTGRFRVPGLAHLARFFYYIGLPYFAMIAGLLTARSLGLAGLEHFSLIGLDPQRAALLLAVEWVLDSRLTILAGLAALVLFGGVLAHLARSGLVLPASPGFSGLAAVYDSAHWAFYRAICWTLTADLYLAVVAGAGLVLLEWLLAARVQPGRPDPACLWLKTIILILTSTIFYFSPNLWLLVPFHLALVGLARWRLSENRARPGLGHGYTD